MNAVIVNIEPWQLLLPLVFIGALLGWLRGWREMAIFVVALIFALLVADAIQTQVPTVLKRLVQIGKEVGGSITDTSNNPNPTPASSPPPGFLDDPRNYPLIMLVVFFFLALACYAIGKAIGTRGGLNLFGRIGGALFGGIGFVIVIYKMLNYWIAYQTNLGHTQQTTVSGGTPAISVPPVQVNASVIPTTNVFADWFPWAVAIFIVLILVYALSRVSRASA